MKTIIIILFLFIAIAVFAEVDEDCFCNLKYHYDTTEDRDIFVDTCIKFSECSLNNDLYYNYVSILTFNAFTLSESDTGKLNFKNLAPKHYDLQNKLLFLDSLLNIESITRKTYSPYNEYHISFGNIIIDYLLNPYLNEIFGGAIIEYPQVIFLSDVETNDNRQVIKIADGIIVNKNGILESVTAYDLYGREIQRFESINSNSLNLNGLKGAYILQVKTNDTIHTIKYFNN